MIKKRISDVRNVLLTFRATRLEAAIIRKLAREAGLSMAEYIIRRCTNA